MSKKQKNALIKLVLFLIALIISYFFNTNESPKNQKPQSSSVSSKTAKHDTVMQQDKLPQNKTAKVDYYMLALSWSPAFCDLQIERNNGKVPSQHQQQCGTSANYGWVIHGLWPQNGNARDVDDHPRYCQGDLPALPAETFKPYLAQSPSENLLQGEWEKHGACAFNQAEDYFRQQQTLFKQLVLPTEALSRNELFKWMKAHNPQLRNVYLGASKTELYICYDKAWQVMDCPKH